MFQYIHLRLQKIGPYLINEDQTGCHVINIEIKVVSKCQAQKYTNSMKITKDIISSDQHIVTENGGMKYSIFTL